MARGRGRRDTPDIANGTLSDLADLGLRPFPMHVEDRRRDTPEVSPVPVNRYSRPSKVVPAAGAKTVRGKPTKAFKIYNQMAFETPRDVAVCVRRSQRKEVLLAIGKGGGKHRPPKRSSWSHIHCRRK